MLFIAYPNMASADSVNEIADFPQFHGMEYQVQEEHLATSSLDNTDRKFDLIIGHVEDIIMEDEFQKLQADFVEKYYEEFDDSEENKFIYTDIHKSYVDLIEKFLLKELSQRVPDFSMDEFQKNLVTRKNDLEGEIFEMLLTFSDFMTFKEMMLDFRAEKEGRTADLSGGLTVTSLTVGAGDTGCPLDRGDTCNNDATMESPRDVHMESPR